MFTNLANELGPHPVRIHLFKKKPLVICHIATGFFHHFQGQIIMSFMGQWAMTSSSQFLFFYQKGYQLSIIHPEFTIIFIILNQLNHDYE